jgi:hypothetical protein
MAGSSFKDGRNSTGDDPRSGRQSVSKTDETGANVREVIHCNHHLNVREVAKEVSI